MNDTVVTVVLGAAADMIEVSTQNGRVLESGPAASLLQASARGFGVILQTRCFHFDLPQPRTQ